MSTNFPTGLDSYSVKVDNVDDVLAQHVNDLQDAIEAIEAKVGVDGSTVSSSHDYKLRHLPAQEQNWDAGNYEIRAKTFYSDAPDGTAPFTVVSTTVVSNLNADTVDGKHASELTEFRSGDLMLSTNTSAPSGWSDVSSTYNNKFIRISSGTPLNTGGSDTHSHTLAVENLPSHTHGAGSLATSSAGSHTHTIQTYKGTAGESSKKVQGETSTDTEATPSTNSAGAHTHSITGSTEATGSGQAFTGDNVPAYVQVRIFEKD